MDTANNQLVTIFGGSGFVGTQLVQLLAHKGYRIRVAVRRPDLAGHLRPLGDVGQVQPVQANLRNAESVASAVHGASIVVNLVGLGFERGKQRFAAIHVEGAASSPRRRLPPARRGSSTCRSSAPTPIPRVRPPVRGPKAKPPCSRPSPMPSSCALR